MAGVVLLARESGRAGRAAAALGWAATLLLVSDPKLIGDAGFQLSSLATAGLVAWGPPGTTWVPGGGRGRGWGGGRGALGGGRGARGPAPAQPRNHTSQGRGGTSGFQRAARAAR